MESQAEEKQSECVCETEVSGESENVEMVVEVTGESGEAGKVMDLTGVAIEALCGLGELGKTGELMGEISKLGEVGETGDMGQTGELGAAVGEVSQATGELGVPGIVTGELRVGTLNMKRARDVRKRALVFDTAWRKRVDVMFLQEIHSDGGTEADWEKEWEGQASLSHNTILSGEVGLLFSRGFTPSWSWSMW
ncbi:hypothetical protein D4764_0268570 [Takifugu flavidus]|uniref:Endonuclease/exonuclease/phosphatase domain-containing protein n=1 Tax=Takifugu flavidus TaxID=433684 RepID=A0A5C6MGH0_9TELE|nr:hypothetical protein D4764_0268570 [Takifugu flavidus]